ncbi:hybrid sensor histidine kinase/response regulator [Magnetococcales bacterium HHB-1]
MTVDKQPISVLIVEDSAIQGVMLKRLLQENGYTVNLAKNGADGLSSAQTLPPDVIITDIAMPEMDGYELCQQVKKDPRLAHIPVMLLTALSDPEEALRGLHAGADNFLTKPYDEEHLLERVRHLVSMPPSPLVSEHETPITVTFDKTEHTIRASRQQVLNLLLSTYENAVHRHTELQKTQTELHLLNEKLEEKVQQRTQQLSAANKAKTLFINNMSHELRTPMNAIIGMTDLALAASEDGEQKKLLTIVQQSATTLQAMLDSLLDFTRLEQKEFTVKPSNFFLRTEMKRLFQNFAERAHKKHLTFALKIRNDVPDQIRGDLRRLQTILIQLASNALKFTEQGHIVVDIAQTSPQSEQKIYLRFSIEDTGIGIANTDKAYVFDLFTQADATATRTYGGAGLGLNLAKKLTEHLGGKIGFSSAQNLGSVFHVTLPLKSLDTEPADFDEEMIIHQQSELSNPEPALTEAQVLTGSQLMIEVEQKLARFKQALENQTLEEIDPPVQWLKKRLSILTEQSDAMNQDTSRHHLLRMVMAARKNNHQDAFKYMEKVRQQFQDLSQT